MKAKWVFMMAAWLHFSGVSSSVKAAGRDTRRGAATAHEPLA